MTTKEELTAQEELIELVLSLTPEQVSEVIHRLPLMHIAHEDVELIYKVNAKMTAYIKPGRLTLCNHLPQMMLRYNASLCSLSN